MSIGYTQTVQYSVKLMTKKIDIDLEKVKELREQGMFVKDIAKALGVSKSTMIRTIKRNDLFYDKLEIPIEELKELRDQGFTLEQIADHFNCERTAITRRVKEHGLFLQPKTLKEHFEERIKENLLTGCIEWQGTIDKYGYGKVSHRDLAPNKVYRLAHRVSYELYKGEIPEGLLVRHMCNNRKCCNPDHLEVGTAKDNYDDAVRAGTLPYIKKKNNPLLEYIERLIKDGWKHREICKYLGIHKSTLYSWRKDG